MTMTTARHDVTIEQLAVEYRSGSAEPVRPVDDFSMQAPAGEITVLIGPSGSGKTSLLSVIGGLLSPAAGSVQVGDVTVTDLDRGQLVEYRRSSVGFVFQSFNLIPSLSVWENIATPLLINGRSVRSARAEAMAIAEIVGLNDRVHHRPSELSGGQKQRVAIARGLVTRPAVLLADEPTANLDAVQTDEVLRLLRGLRNEGRSIIVSSHDQRTLSMADSVIVMADAGRSEEWDPAEVHFAEGEMITEEGTWGDLIFEIEEGTVAVGRLDADGSLTAAERVGKGQFVGVYGPLLGQPRWRTALALTDVRARAMSVASFRQHRGDRRPRPEAATTIDLEAPAAR